MTPNEKMNAVKNTVMRYLKALEIILFGASASAIWALCYYPDELSPRISITVAVAAVYMIMFACMVRVYDGFDCGGSRISELLLSQTLALLVSDSAFYLLVCLLNEKFINPLPILILFLAEILFAALLLWTLNRIRLYKTDGIRSAIIYNSNYDLHKIMAIPHFSENFKTVCTVSAAADFDSVFRMIADVKAVFISGVGAELKNDVIRYGYEKGITVYVIPELEDVMMKGAGVQKNHGVVWMRVRHAMPRPEYYAVKRCLDILFSMLGIIVTAPIMLFIAACIRISDKGPVFYRQTRLTLHGKKFRILKFRSMRTDAEKDGIARLANDHDSRITPVGKFLRTYRLDELPQLFNVLIGSMSLVGPRPERPEIASEYEKELPEFPLRLLVKAGITGYAQIYGKYNSEPKEKLLMDLLYINHLSLLEDIRLMLATVKTLFMKESTEGVAEGQTTAEVTAKKIKT